MLGSFKRTAAVTLGVLAFSTAASAAPIISLSLTRDSDDPGTEPDATWGWSGEGSGSGPAYDYSHEVRNDNWDFKWNGTGDPDPLISNNIVVVNNTLATQTFTAIASIPIAPNLPAPTLRGGSVGVTLTDLTPTPVGAAALNAVAGSSIYKALVNGVTEHTLLDAPFGLSTFTSTSTSADFGGPIPPTLPGGAANNTIGITLEFTLTPGDSASITSVFIVEVPEPASVSVLAMAGVGLLGRRRRA